MGDIQRIENGIAQHIAVPLGGRIGHYTIVDRLGAGGMGEVYLAQDTRLGRKVAIKLLPTHFAQDADHLRRFQQESRAAVEVLQPSGALDYEIRSASPEDGPSRLLACIPAHRMPEAGRFHPVISPDGKWLALPLTDGVATHI